MNFAVRRSERASRRQENDTTARSGLSRGPEDREFPFQIGAAERGFTKPFVKISNVGSHSPVDDCPINLDLNPRILSAVRSFYRMLLNPRKRLETQGFKQVNNSISVIRSRPLLRASRELAREKSREDIGFWNVKDKASVGGRDVTSQQTCTPYQPKTSYKTGKRPSEDARFFHSLEVRYFEQPQHIPSQAAGQTAQGEGGPRPHTPAPGRDGCPHPPDGAAPIS